MKLLTDKTALLEALGRAVRAVTSKPVIPVLNGVLLRASADGVTVTGYDLEMAIEASMFATLEAEGEAVLPAKQMLEIAKKLPNSDVVIESKDGSAKIQADRAKFTLQIMPAAEYPTLPTTDGVAVAVPGGVMCETITKVAFAAAKHDSRAFLSGVLTKIADGNLTMVATDSFRMAVRTVPAEGELEPTLLPARFLAELARTTGETIELIRGGSWAQAKTGRVRYLSRLLEGQYPPYEKVLPDEGAVAVWVTAEREALLGALERVSVLCKDDLAAVQLTLDEDTHDHLIITSTNPAVGEAREELVIFSDCAEGHGSMTVALRPRYLREALRAATGKDVRIGYTDNRKPVLIRDEDEGYRYVVMPVMKP
jgi:DNA polymerase-3 subunit beta